MRDFIDADDRRLLGQGAIYALLAVALMLIGAAGVGLAWTVLKLTGGF